MHVFRIFYKHMVISVSNEKLKTKNTNHTFMIQQLQDNTYAVGLIPRLYKTKWCGRVRYSNVTIQIIFTFFVDRFGFGIQFFVTA